MSLCFAGAAGVAISMRLMSRPGRNEPPIADAGAQPAGPMKILNAFHIAAVKYFFGGDADTSAASLARAADLAAD